MAPLLVRFLWIAAALLGAGAAAAHDTWFEPLPAARPGEVLLKLGTGNRFPRHEFTVGEASLREQGCRRSGAKAVRSIDTQPESCSSHTYARRVTLPQWMSMRSRWSLSGPSVFRS